MPAQVAKPLNNLLAGLAGEPAGPTASTTVTGISTDSRLVSPGDLFVALPGEHAHGQRYAAAAAAAGAVAMVAPPETPWPSGLPGLRHPAPEEILAELAARLYDRPAERMRVFGVTGTNGKTTTALLTGWLLRAGGRRVAHWTTTEVDDGGAPFRPVWTTPPAHRLHRFLHDALQAGCDHAVIEVSSHAVVQRRTAGITFAAGIATNVSPDHLDFHKTFAAYVAAKRAFITGLPASAIAVLNADDPIVSGFGAATAARPIRFGFSPNAGLRALDVHSDAGGTRFTVGVAEDVRRADGCLLARGGPLRIPLLLPLIGRHNVSNALAAIGATLWAGVSPEAIAVALPAFPTPPRRLEPQTVGPYTVMNDVAMNEASYETVLRTVADLAYPQVVVVHAVRGQRGPEINARIGRALAAWNSRLVFQPLIVSLSRSRLRRYPVNYEVTDAELAAFTAAAGDMTLDVQAELEDAIAAALNRLQPGGLLLLLGTFGMDDGPALAVERLRAKAGAGDAAPRRYMDQRERD